MYEYTDRALAILNRRLIRIFRRLKLLDFDELNVVNEVRTAYRQADGMARKTYLDVGIHAYLFALKGAAKAGFDAKWSTSKAALPTPTLSKTPVMRSGDGAVAVPISESAIAATVSGTTVTTARSGEIDIPDADATPINADWIQDMLFEADPVTLYEYAPEWERKRQRLIEALAATNKPSAEIDKALKYLVLQVSHYADKSTKEAAIKALKDAGVEKVVWITEQDDKVCAKCGPLDGTIYEIEKVPPLQHYRCRCAVKPVD